MKIDGKEKVKKRIKIFENSKYITYLYIFKNGNSYKESVPKWKQKDFSNVVPKTTEEKLDDHLNELVYRR